MLGVEERDERLEMKKLRVLVLGATGMLGHKLCEVLSQEPALEVHATTRSNARASDGPLVIHGSIDVMRGASTLGPLLEHVAPDVIVNAVGAIKQRNLREAIDETFLVNGTLPHLLALLNPNRSGRVVHFSTDCVFSGHKGRYRESDSPDVTDLYGRSKAIGEIDYGPHLTLRTSIVGFEHRGFLGLLSWFVSHPPGARVPGFTDAIYSGLPTITLARTLRDLLLSPKPLSGLYHVASEPISKHDLLVLLNEALGLETCIEPDRSVRIDRSLDDSRFRSETATPRPSWAMLVAELKQDYVDRGYEAIYGPRRHRPPA